MLDYQFVGHTKFGGPDVLDVHNGKLDPPGANQLRLKVKAVSVNPIDYKRRDGMLKMMEPSRSAPMGICHDVVGTVESVGSGVNAYQVGDLVAARARHPGTFATATLVDEDVAAKVPEGVSVNDAAAVPLAGMTALQVFRAAGLRAGETVFISGGSGGVGHYALQLAKHHFKASRVVTTCSTGKVDFCKSLGADEVIDYTQYEKNEQYKGQGKFDVVFDTTGDVRAMVQLGKPGRKVISIAVVDAPLAPEANIAVKAMLTVWGAANHVSAWWAGTQFQMVLMKPNHDDLALLLTLLHNNKLKTEIAKTYSGLQSAKDAFEELEHGHVAGKIVIEI